MLNPPSSEAGAPFECAQLDHHGSAKIKDFNFFLRASSYYQKLIERWEWQSTVLNTIDWNIFKDARTQCMKWKRINLITYTKLVNKLLPTASRQHQCDPSRPASCPTCHHPEETEHHFYTCSHPTWIEWRSTLRTQLIKKYADQPDTDPHLATILLEGLFMSFQDLPLQFPNVPERYHRLWHQQSSIGWTGLFSGHVSQEWSRLQ